MKELELELTIDELKELKFNEEAIRNIIVSRAIYNESLNYEFTKEELVALNFFVDSEKVRYYVKSVIEPKVMINENQIIDTYNANKAYFEENKISFKDAHEIIKEQLKNQMISELDEDFVGNLVENMSENVSITKEQMLYSRGDAEVLKQIIQNNLVMEEANKNKFFEQNSKTIDLILNDLRMKYYVRVLNSKEVKLTEEEVENYYNEHSKEFEGIDSQVAYSQIYNMLGESKLNAKVNEYALSMINKYNINSIVAKAMEKEVIN